MKKLSEIRKLMEKKINGLNIGKITIGMETIHLLQKKFGMKFLVIINEINVLMYLEY